MVDKAENINLWPSLAYGHETASDNGRRWRPLTVQTIKTL